MFLFDALLRMMEFTTVSNKSEMTPASDDLPQDDGLLWESHHRSSPGGWPEPQEESELIAQIEKLQRVCRELSARLEKKDEDVRRARKSQISSAEKVRRQSELLKEAEQRADAALKENRELVIKLAQLQRWADCLDDEEAGRTMCKFYQNLQSWITRHFGNEPFEMSTEHADASTSPNDVSVRCQSSHRAYVERISEISMEISWHIFNSILTRFMIGFTCSLSLTKLGPPHVWQHWRSATSNADASLAHQKIDADCDRIVYMAEHRFAHLSGTDYRKRTGELKTLLWQIIGFRKRLEGQAGFYYFWRSSLNRPFRSEHMVSLTADDPSDEVVESSVWPMLYKSVPGGEVIVQKELVTTMQPRIHHASEGSCLQGETGYESP